MPDQVMNIDLPLDYVLSDGEVNNLVYLTLKYSVGFNMRKADFLVVKTMVPVELRGAAATNRVVKEACEYAWDHLSGEPEEFCTEDLFGHMTPIIEDWYKNTTPAERAQTK